MDILEAWTRAIQEGIVFDDDFTATQVAWCFKVLRLEKVEDLASVGVDDLLLANHMTLRGVIAMFLFAQAHDIKIVRGFKKFPERTIPWSVGE